MVATIVSPGFACRYLSRGKLQAKSLFDLPFAAYYASEMWLVMGALLGWRTTQKQAMDILTTLSIISALIITLSFPALIMPPPFMALADADGLTKSGCQVTALEIIYQLSVSTCIGANFIVVFFSALVMIALTCR
jgi:hypothetical protein